MAKICKTRVEAFGEVERSLNEINYKGCGIGSSLSYYFDRLYRGDFYTSLLKNILTTTYFILKAGFINKKIVNYQKDIIYFKTADFPHLEALANSLTKDELLQKKILIVSTASKSSLAKNKFLFLYNIGDLLNVLKFILINHRTILSKLQPLNLNFTTRINVLLNLNIQLLKTESFITFLKFQKSTKVVCGDYDRGADSSIFFLAAKKILQKRSFTLQHGAINPPVGYTPLNADEIWVWGDMAKAQLSELGVNYENIVITGTPLIEEMKMTDEKKSLAKTKWSDPVKTTIVLALSSPNLVEEKKLVKFLAEIKESLPIYSYDFFVKIHPARPYNDYFWIKRDFKISILPKDIPKQDFMNFSDVLLIHSSGIATEAIHFNIKVGVLDILESPPGNGTELHKFYNIPLITSINEFQEFLKVDSALAPNNTPFFKIGLAAEKEIQERINDYISC